MQTIVIVDDQPDVRARLRALLELDGLRVIGVAADGREAIARIAALAPDAAIVDVGLPDVDGFEVAAVLRARGIPTPVVLTSSRDAASFASRMAASSARGFIPKDELSAAALRTLLVTDAPLRVVIADDAALVRAGLARLLMDAGFMVDAEVASATELLAAVRLHDPDVVVVDVRMPPTHTDEGLVAAQAIRDERGARPGILVLSTIVETRSAMRLLADGTGGIGYLLKDRVGDVGEFTEALRRVALGGSVIDPQVVARLVSRRRASDGLGELTDREREVLALIAEGRSNQAISDLLFLSPKTTETHIASIFSKLDLVPAPDDHRRVLAVLAYLRG